MSSPALDQSFWIPAPTLTEKNLDDQKGKVFIVTGGYVGVGYQLSRILHQRHGTVYIAGRSKQKADAAILAIKKENPSSQGRLEFLELDLADLASVAKAASDFMSREDRLDVLTNNAGVCEPPVGSRTCQGHELQMGTNCLGPFLFTKLLLPILQKTASTAPTGVRVTWAGSLGAHLQSPPDGIQFDGDGSPRNQTSQGVNYGQSKAGNFYLAREFSKRLKDDGVVSVAFNPGNLRSEMQRYGSTMRKVLVHIMSHPAVYGAYTELYAGWSKDITLEKTGAWVIPWGRLGRLRDDIEKGCENGVSAKFWAWCEAESKEFCSEAAQY
ncbi:short-chain alcohol dehydrogenase [Fusarium falciforme]